MIKTMDLATFQRKFLSSVKQRGQSQFEEIKSDVQAIIDNVKEKGNVAIVEYEEKFDKIKLNTTQLKVSSEEIEVAYTQVDSEILNVIKEIIRNISTFHEAQKRDKWYVETSKGVSVGQIMRPLESVGVYVPGGKALYPSTVTMTVVPAKIAGVKEVILCTPPRPDGSVDPVVLVTAKEAGADSIFKIGGVQAIAAMAYGTKTVPAVNKIVGPGNKYVNAAKIIVSTSIGIDLPAGPSEVLIIADETSDPNLIAIDLISQAEHDENAYCFLITTSKILADQVNQAISQLVPNQSRKSIVQKALKDNSYIILVEDIAQAIELSNDIAPEHLEIQIQDSESILSQITNAGAIFLGKNSPVPVGDYAAGSNHVLPTGGTAKIYSGLSIFSFLKLIDVVKCSVEGLRNLLPWIKVIAKVEGLEAHIQSIQMRLKE